MVHTIMKLLILILLTLSLQAKVCDHYLIKAKSDLDKSYIGGQKERSLKAMYAMRASVSLSFARLCMDVNDYSVEQIRKVLEELR